jgi:hypothetical protein
MLRVLSLQAVLALVSVAAADAQILPLITERSGGSSSFWWEEPADPAFSDFEQALLREAAGLIIDVSTLSDPPGVSRIYRVPDLSATNARNLGGLFEANQVLVGDLVVGESEMAAGGFFWVAEAEISYRLLSVDVEVTHAESRRIFLGRGTDAAAARDAAVSHAAEYLAEVVSRLQSRLDPTAEADATSPTLLLIGLERAATLVALKGELRRHGEIVTDVREVWASEGVIALEVELAPGKQMGDLEQLLMAIEGDESRDQPIEVGTRRGMTLEVRSRAPLPEDLEP